MENQDKEFQPALPVRLPYEVQVEYNKQCVEVFANSMVSRLVNAAANGKSGWWNKEAYPHENLKQDLFRALNENRSIDAANYLMMAHLRGESVSRW